MLVTQSCLTLCDSIACSLPVPLSWNSKGKNTKVGSLSLLQGFFPTQGLNLSLLHCIAGRFFITNVTWKASYQASAFFCEDRAEPPSRQSQVCLMHILVYVQGVSYNYLFYFLYSLRFVLLGDRVIAYISRVWHCRIWCLTNSVSKVKHII